MINNCSLNQISFKSCYHSDMVDAVNKAIKDNGATIHCAYTGDVFTTSKKHRPSIEHIKPHSEGGEDKDFNFLPVDRKINSERGCIPIPEYIKIHHEVIENVKRTISEVARIKSPKFDGKKWAQGVIKTFKEEFNIDMKIDLDEIEPTIFVEDKIKKAKPVHEKNKPAESNESFQMQLEKIKKQLVLNA